MDFAGFELCLLVLQKQMSYWWNKYPHLMKTALLTHGGWRWRKLPEADVKNSVNEARHGQRVRLAALSEAVNLHCSAIPPWAEARPIVSTAVPSLSHRPVTMRLFLAFPNRRLFLRKGRFSWRGRRLPPKKVWQTFSVGKSRLPPSQSPLAAVWIAHRGNLSANCSVLQARKTSIRPSSRQLYHSNNFFKRRGPGCHGAAAPPRVTAAAPAAVRTAARQGAAAHPRRARGGEHGARLPRPPSRSRRAAAQRQRPRAAARHLCGTGGGAAGEAPAHCAPRGPSPPRPQSLPAPVPIRLRGQRPPLWRDRGE